MVKPKSFCYFILPRLFSFFSFSFSFCAQLIKQAFIVHLAGLDVSIYWAEFPHEYLHTIRHRNIAKLDKNQTIKLHHTRPRSLINPDSRDHFLREFISLIRCLAEGHANVGYLRQDLDDNPIHKQEEDMEEKRKKKREMREEKEEEERTLNKRKRKKRKSKIVQHEEGEESPKRKLTEREDKENEEEEEVTR